MAEQREGRTLMAKDEPELREVHQAIARPPISNAADRSEEERVVFYNMALQPTPDRYIDRVMFYEKCPDCNKVRPVSVTRCLEWEGAKSKVLTVIHDNAMVAHITVHHPERI